MRVRRVLLAATMVSLVVASLSGTAVLAAKNQTPNTTITSSPSSPTSSTSASFSFTSTRTPATFTCRLDSGVTEACVSPKTYSGLGVGSHTFTVTAVYRGTADPSPATFTWVIDQTLPSTPTNLAATTPTATSVRLTWTASTDNIAVGGYDIFRDGASLASVGAVTTFTDSAVAVSSTHTYGVRARDTAGNVSALTDPPISVTLPTPPDTIIDSAPPAGTTSTDATFTFHSTVIPATFTCKLDAAPAASCTSPTAYSGLGIGTHTFTVYATAGGFDDPGAAMTTWTVSSEVGGGGPALLDANAVNASRVELAWTAVPSATLYTVRRDGVVLASGPMLSAIDASIAPGSTYVYDVTATLGGLETGPSPFASVAVPTVLDAQAPTSPGNLRVTATASGNVTLGFNRSTDNVGVIGYFVKLSGVLYAYTEGSLTVNVTNLKASTTYDFDVYALDAAGYYSAPAQVSATTAALDINDTTAPAAPRLTATAYSANVVDLSWKTPSDADLAGYLLFRGSQQIADLPANTHVQTRILPVTGLAPDTAYTFSIRSYDTAGNQSTAASKIATTLATTDVRVTYGPIVQRVSANAARVVWRTNVAAPGSLTYSTGGNDVTVRDPTPTTDHDILIGPLPSLSSVTYTLNYATPVSGSLRTCSVSPATFTLDVVGDMGGGSSAETNIANLIAADQPDLIASVGDNVYPTGADKDHPSKLLTQYASAMRNSAFFTAYGNHEYYDPGAAATHRIFSQPGNESYFSFDCSGVHVSVVDVYQPYGPGSAQYQWLTNDLASTAQPWKVVVLHVPPYSSSVAGVAPGSTGLLNSVYEQYGVQLVLAGHSHNYERSNVINGVTYIVDGGGGNGLNDFSGTPPSWSAYRAAEFSYLRLTFASTGIAGTQVRQDGTTGDSFTIAPPVPGPPNGVIDSAPTGRTSATDATISFHSVPNGATFMCSLDASPPAPCTSPVTYAGLYGGAHVVSVVATNAIGTDATPATASWTVDSSPPVFVDGFETGDLTGWSPAAGLVVESTDVRSGVYAAEGILTTGARYAKKTLPTPLADAYTRVAFKLRSQASQVNLLRVRDATGASIGYVYLSPTGLLGFRNDVAALGKLSTLAPGPGWHALELHVTVNGLASMVEVWVDGSPVSALSSTTNLGTAPVGIFQIGETQTSQTYDVAFDDAAVATARLGPVSDSTPPSSPSDVVATATSSASVQLGWIASTDDIGIAGYDVFRNGAPLASLGDVTAWTDTTVVASTTYDYAVRARDTSGNRSALSATTSATTLAPAAPVFADGFESGDLSAWTTKDGLTVESTDVRSGGFAAEGNVTLTGAYAKKTLGGTYVDAYARVGFAIKSQGANDITLLRLRDAPLTSIGYVYVTIGGKLGFRADAATVGMTSNTTVGPGWHAVELHLLVNGTSSTVEVWLDGALVGSLSGTGMNLGTNPVSVLQIGDTAGTFDVVLDDAAFGTARLGSVADSGPTVPTNLVAATPSPYSVSLTWAASTDDIGVVGYDVFRDDSLYQSLGAVLGYTDTVLTGSTHTYAVRARDTSGNRSALTSPVTATTTTDNPPSVPANLLASAPTAYAANLTWEASTDEAPIAGYDVFRGGEPLVSLGNVTAYTDVVVHGGTTYQYTVLARDAAGNSSAQSDPASAAVPAAPAPVFADSFESGDLSAWTSTAPALTVKSTDVHSGGFAAVSNVANAAAYARESVASTGDAYARVWFKVNSRTTQVTLLSLRDSGNALRSVFLTSAGNIGISGGTSGTAPTQGVWHALELHLVINGASSIIEVWLDGAVVAGLPTTVNVGTATGIIELQIGDSQATNRTYDIVYDDAAFGAARIGL